MIPPLIRSAVHGIRSPAIPRQESAYVLAMLYQLEQSQWRSSDEVFGHQRRQLAALFDHASRTVPFYGRRFEKAGFTPDDEITADAIRRIPILTRADLQNAGDEIRTRALPRDHGKTRVIQTSGSTGRPVKVHATTITELFWRASVLREIAWHKRDLSGKLAAIRWRKKGAAMAPDGHRAERWPMPVGRIYDTGPSAFLNIASDINAQVEWLLRENPDYLVSYPSNLMALAAVCEKTGHRPSRLRQVITVGETVTDVMRKTIRAAWGVPVTDSYTCEETGYLALQCPDHEHYHVQSENVYLEVVDDNGDPCRVGEVGRVLVTSLHNFASPLIRYELGDYAEMGEACPCGRGLPVIRRVLGRRRNRLIMPSGESQFPYLGEHEDFAAITTSVLEFQYVQRSVEEVEKKMVVSQPLTADQEEKMRALIIKNLGYPFRITLSYHDEIPRSPRGKFEEFISEVAQ